MWINKLPSVECDSESWNYVIRALVERTEIPTVSAHGTNIMLILNENHGPLVTAGWLFISHDDWPSCPCVSELETIDLLLSQWTAIVIDYTKSEAFEKIREAMK